MTRRVSLFTVLGGGSVFIYAALKAWTLIFPANANPPEGSRPLIESVACRLLDFRIDDIAVPNGTKTLLSSGGRSQFQVDIYLEPRKWRRMDVLKRKTPGVLTNLSRRDSELPAPECRYEFRCSSPDGVGYDVASSMLMKVHSTAPDRIHSSGEILIPERSGVYSLVIVIVARGVSDPTLPDQEYVVAECFVEVP